MAQEPVFTIERTFNVSRERLWEVFTQPEHMEHWMGPKGSKGKTVAFDFRPGGMYHYAMTSPDGKNTMYGRCIYREIVPPQKIVYIQSFADQKAQPVRHPMSPTWPMEMLTTIVFSEQGGKTTMKLQWTPINPTPEERKTFEDGMSGMTQGWTGALDQLQDYLSREQQGQQQ